MNEYEVDYKSLIKSALEKYLPQDEYCGLVMDWFYKMDKQKENEIIKKLVDSKYFLIYDDIEKIEVATEEDFRTILNKE